MIGAGAAGLAALQVLDRAGLRVVLLEARDRVGGRIQTLRDPLSSLPLELGAEFVHGRPTELWELIRDAGLTVYDATDASRRMNNGTVERNEDAWLPVNSVMEDMREAAKGPDQPFEQFLRTSVYSDDVKQTARGYVEGFNAADSNVISIQSLAEDDAAADAIDGDRIFRFAGGYDAVPLHLLRSVPDFGEKLRLNSVVERVEWTRGEVSVDARNGLTNALNVFRAQCAVVTLPLGVLQTSAVRFSPRPKPILDAAQRLEFGQVYRVVLRFREAFWEKNDALKDAGFILSQEALFPTWWTTLAIRSTLLTGWSAGAHADALKGFSREQVLQTALASLARITGVPSTEINAELEALYFHDWRQDPYSLGAYSYVPVEALEARKELCVPVEDTLYFAGEATDQSGHSATVHGAIASGRRAAAQILAARANS